MKLQVACEDLKQENVTPSSAMENNKHIKMDYMHIIAGFIASVLLGKISA